MPREIYCNRLLYMPRQSSFCNSNIACYLSLLTSHISISLLCSHSSLPSAYVLTCLWFAYVEGYKGFQRKFSPLVVSRSLTLHPRSPPHHLLLAPLYSMGMFHATKKRVIVSWSVTLGVAALIAGVKRMPYPWRNVVDAGVVVGLSWGMLSILVCYVMACIKGESPTDPSLPENNNNKQD